MNVSCDGFVRLLNPDSTILVGNGAGAVNGKRRREWVCRILL